MAFTQFRSTEAGIDLVQGEVKALLQSALEVALSVIRANPAVLEGLGAYLEGNLTYYPPMFLWCTFLHELASRRLKLKLFDVWYI